MGIDFAVDCEVKKLKQKDVVNLTGIKEFEKAVQKFIVAMAEKLLEITSLVSSLLQSTIVFDPQNLLQMSKEKAFDLFKSLLTNIQLNILPPNRCDQALAEFKNCLDVKIEGIKLTSFVFSQKEHRLDGFFFKELGIAKYKELSYLVRIIFTLSHGQVALERSFNCQPNMTPNTLILK